MDIYGRGNIYLNSDIEKPGRSGDFPEGTGCMLWFFIMYAGTKFKAKLDYALMQNIKGKKKKMLKFRFFQGSCLAFS